MHTMNTPCTCTRAPGGLLRRKQAVDDAHPLDFAAAGAARAPAYPSPNPSPNPSPSPDPNLNPNPTPTPNLNEPNPNLNPNPNRDANRAPAAGAARALRAPRAAAPRRRPPRHPRGHPLTGRWWLVGRCAVATAQTEGERGGAFGHQLIITCITYLCTQMTIALAVQGGNIRPPRALMWHVRTYRYPPAP